MDVQTVMYRIRGRKKEGTDSVIYYDENTQRFFLAPMKDIERLAEMKPKESFREAYNLWFRKSAHPECCGLTGTVSEEELLFQKYGRFAIVGKLPDCEYEENGLVATILKKAGYDKPAKLVIKDNHWEWLNLFGFVVRAKNTPIAQRLLKKYGGNTPLNDIPGWEVNFDIGDIATMIRNRGYNQPARLVIRDEFGWDISLEKFIKIL
jgi:hypothetical protein